MTTVRGRRSGTPADGRRAGVRGPARTSATGPVRMGVRARSPNRPGQRRAGRRPSRAAGPASRRSLLFTGRTVLLGALVLLLALTLAGPVRQFLAGRAELARLAAEGQTLEQQAEDYQAQLDRQEDSAWMAREARERLTYVAPGDRLVIVADGGSADGDAGSGPAGTPGRTTALPWYEGLLESVAVADGDRPGGGQPGGGSRGGG